MQDPYRPPAVEARAPEAARDELARGRSVVLAVMVSATVSALVAFARFGSARSLEIMLFKLLLLYPLYLGRSWSRYLLLLLFGYLAVGGLSNMPRLGLSSAVELVLFPLGVALNTFCFVALAWPRSVLVFMAHQSGRAPKVARRIDGA
jgi:hypothetical protein